MRARVVTERLTTTAKARLTSSHATFKDDIVGSLVAEMLYGETFDMRLYAGSLIGATPYRQPLADALRLELMTPYTARDPETMAALITALRFLGGPPERNAVERVLLATNTPPPVRRLAAFALGHIGGTTTPDFWGEAIQHYGRQWTKYRSPISASVLDGIAYGLGMTRNKKALITLRDDHLTPAPARIAASWWLNLPNPVWRSTR